MDSLYEEILRDIKQFEAKFLNKFHVKVFLYFTDMNGMFVEYKRIIDFTFCNSNDKDGIYFVSRYFRDRDTFVLMPSMGDRRFIEKDIQAFLFEKDMKMHEAEKYIRNELLTEEFYKRLDALVDRLNNIKRLNRNLF